MLNDIGHINLSPIYSSYIFIHLVHKVSYILQAINLQISGKSLNLEHRMPIKITCIIIYLYEIAIVHYGMQSFHIIVYCTPVYCTLVMRGGGGGGVEGVRVGHYTDLHLIRTTCHLDLLTKGNQGQQVNILLTLNISKNAAVNYIFL